VTSWHVVSRLLTVFHNFVTGTLSQSVAAADHRFNIHL